MGLVLERSVERDKVYALIFNAEATKRQPRFLPARKRKLAKATIMHEHAVERNRRCVETGVRRTQRAAASRALAGHSPWWMVRPP